jgi:hypothetical protein
VGCSLTATSRAKPRDYRMFPYGFAVVAPALSAANDGGRDDSRPAASKPLPVRDCASRPATTCPIHIVSGLCHRSRMNRHETTTRRGTRHCRSRRRAGTRVVVHT